MSLHKTVYLLVFVGALNWGLVGLFGFNLVSALFGFSPMLENLVYILVGVSALVDMKNHMYCCGECSVEEKPSKKKGKK